MRPCKHCLRDDTKYSCIICGCAVCQVCSIKADESDEEYIEKEKNVGYCKSCNKPSGLGISGKRRNPSDEEDGISSIGIVYKNKPTKQTSLASFFGGKAKTTLPKRTKPQDETKKTSSKPRMVTVDTVTNSWIEQILAGSNAREWLEFDVDGKYAINLRCKVTFLLNILILS